MATFQIPGRIVAGDTLRWTDQVPDYPASDGWTLHYAIFSDQGIYHVDATASGTDHAFDVPASQTAKWQPGRYEWTAYVDNAAGERHTLGAGFLQVLPDPAATTPQDRRSHARRMLDAIEAALEQRATEQDLDLLRAQFGDQRVDRDPAQLIALRDRYRAEVQAEERAAALARGEAVPPRSLKVRF